MTCGQMWKGKQKIFPSVQKEKTHKVLKWQSYANVSYYWIIAELHRQGDGIGSLQSFIPAPIC